MTTTNISWADKTWNPVVGCTRVSEGCDHCYAVGMTRRLEGAAKAPGMKNNRGLQRYVGLTVKQKPAAVEKGIGVNGYHFNGEVRCDEDALLEPLAWKKSCVCFVNSMGDVFHEKVPFEFLDKMYAVMALCPHVTFKVLTKRAGRMAEYFESEPWKRLYEDGVVNMVAAHSVAASLLWHVRKIEAETPRGALKWPLPNVIHGVSVENQRQADERIPHLLRVPGRRFLSLEPLLGPVDLEEFFWTMNDGRRYGRINGIHGVVIGGESDPGARPFDVLWAESLLTQCRDAGVPFHLKQLGSNPVSSFEYWNDGNRTDGKLVGDVCHWKLHSRNGSDMAEWTEHLRVREEVGGSDA